MCLEKRKPPCPQLSPESKAGKDVHGAGCQRSDPKAGDLSDYTDVPYGYYFGNAPQGDAIRLDNYVRCVRDAPQSATEIFAPFSPVTSRVGGGGGVGGAGSPTNTIAGR